jgi:flavin-dependent dehydrogenase
MMSLLAFPGGYGGMVHTDRDRISLSLCIRRDTLKSCRAKCSERAAGDAVLHHILGSCRGVRETLGNTTMEGRWFAAGPIAPGMRPVYSGGVFRVGNAAGEAHPIVAEGISMAMQSASLLSRELIGREKSLTSRQARDEAGRSYAAAWRRQFASRIRWAALFANLAMRPASAPLLLPLLRTFPSILTLGASLSGKRRNLRGAESTRREQPIACRAR